MRTDMSLKRSGDWRDRAASELMSRVLAGAGTRGTVLVMLEPRPEVATAVNEAGGTAQSWHRFAREGRSASAWIPAGPYSAATLRLPKAKDELEMAVHAAASVLEVGAPLWVYGANDEGAGSASGVIEPLLGQVRTVKSGGRCRVLEAARPVDVPGVRGSLPEWRQSTSLEFPDGQREWISYPGTFAHGRMDSGTEALLEALRSYPLAGQQVLDFACGAGLVGAFLSALQPQVRVELLDVDALALAAASENVPGARLIHSDGFRALEDERYNLIVSNPPYHEGKAETGKIVESLVRGAPDHLVAGGSLVLVTQRRLPLADLMGATFNQVEVLLDAGSHRVWLGGM